MTSFEGRLGDGESTASNRRNKVVSRIAGLRIWADLDLKDSLVMVSTHRQPEGR